SGQTASAWASFREASELAEKRGDARKELADQRAAALQPRLSKLLIRVSTLPGLQVQRDDVQVGAALWGAAIPSDPGAHLVKVSAPGKRTWQGRAVVKADGSTTTLAVPELEAADAASPVSAVPPPPKAQGAVLPQSVEPGPQN